MKTRFFIWLGIALAAGSTAQAATLDEALGFLRLKLESHGSYRHAISGGQSAWFDYSVTQNSLSSCQLSYTVQTLITPRPPVAFPPSFFPVHEVVLKTTNDEQDVSLSFTRAGLPPGPEGEYRRFEYSLAEMDPNRVEIVTYNDAAQMYSVMCPGYVPCTRLGFATFRFTDLEVAQRVQRALRDAVRLCGGREGFPY